MNKKNEATTVTLRKKSIKGNKQSLYLDFYPPVYNLRIGKETRREFLNLYVFSEPATPEEHEHNKRTLFKAEAIKLERVNYFKHVRSAKELLKEGFLMECGELFERLFYKIKLHVKPRHLRA